MERNTGRYGRGWLGRIQCRLNHKEFRLSGFVLRNRPQEFCTRCGAFRKVRRSK